MTVSPLDKSRSEELTPGLGRPSQLMGVATLEFGVCLHSVIIGLTLAVTGDSEFDVLFVVIIFHQVCPLLLFLRWRSGGTKPAPFGSRRCLKVSVSVLVSSQVSSPSHLKFLQSLNQSVRPGLAFLRLGPQYAWLPWVGAVLYSLCTPIGMAIGLGVREGLVRSSLFRGGSRIPAKKEKADFFFFFFCCGRAKRA